MIELVKKKDIARLLNIATIPSPILATCGITFGTDIVGDGTTVGTIDATLGTAIAGAGTGTIGEAILPVGIIVVILLLISL